MFPSVRKLFSFGITLTLSADKAASYYVGDAAGRPGDHAATDRKWALNVEISFFTPEVFAVHELHSF
jgi:hypothetical protein